jgi:hypothetical protein
MEPHSQFCHNPACPARGQTGQGNITLDSHRGRRNHCTVCQQIFTARRGTPYYRGHVPTDIQTCILTLFAYGCPV